MPGKGIDYVLTLNATKFQSGLNAVSSKSKETAAAVESFWKKSEQGSAAAQSSVERLSSRFSGVKVALAGALAGGGAAYYANEVRKIADEYTNLESRLKLVTVSQEEYNLVRQRLYGISQETGTEYAGNASAYAKLAASMKELGAESEEILNVTELVNKALIVNGSTGEEASSFMLQFAQAMGSGVLQGDELRAMLESNALFARELAKALGTNIAGLRDMGSNGELTASRLREAFPKMAREINEQFSKIAPTTSRALTMLENSYKRIIDDSNKASDGTGTVASSLINLAQTIDTHREGIISLFTKMISLASSTVAAVGNIGQSFAGWDAVFNGKLSFFEFATMDAKELNGWLKKNVKELGDTSTAAKQSGTEISNAAKLSAIVQKQATGDALKEMAKKYKDYAKEVKQLQGTLGDDARSLAEELRDMSRSGLSDIKAWKDRKKEAGEFAKAANEAAAAGKAAFKAGNDEQGKENFKIAAEYADKSKAAYRSLNEEVKSGDQVVISQAQALKTAMTGMQEAGKIKADVVQQQMQAMEQAKKILNEQSGGQLDKSVDDVKLKVQDLSKVIEESGGNWGKVYEAMKASGTDAIDAVNQKAGEQRDQIVAVERDWVKAAGSMRGVWVEALDDLGRKIDETTKARTVTVYTNVVEKRATGGMIGAYKLGGLIQALANGGGVRNILRGGSLPGFGGGDRRLLLGEDGEFMINKWSTALAGGPALRALNAGRIDLAIAELSKRLKHKIGYHLGGIIGSLPQIPVQALAAGGAVSGGSGGYNSSFSFTDQSGQPGRVHGSEIDIRRLEAAINKHNRFRSSNR